MKLDVCPKCNQTDQIKKVSGLYNANTKEWVETHTSTDSEGHDSFYQETHQARTVLGQQLAPPLKPDPPRNPTTIYIFGCTILGFLGFIGLMIVVVTGVILGAFTYLPPVQAALPAWVIYAGLAVLCLGSLIALGILFWVASKYKQSKAKYELRKVQWEKDVLPRWQQAMDRWNRMYYCARDETVFVPGEMQAVPVAEAQAFINREFR